MTGTGRQARTQSFEERRAEADTLAGKIGRGAFCYAIGTVVYRGERRGVYQCEFPVGPVHCYIPVGGKAQEVDDFLGKRGAHETLAGSSLERLACVTV